MNNDINKLQSSPFKNKLIRTRLGTNTKRRIAMTAKNLYTLLQCEITYKRFCIDIQDTPLRQDIDYQLTDKHLVLSISAVQAILVMSNTEISWQLHHALTDLIHNGFSDI